MNFTGEDIDLAQEITDFMEKYSKDTALNSNFIEQEKFRFIIKYLAKIENENNMLKSIIQNMRNEISYLKDGTEPLR